MIYTCAHTHWINSPLTLQGVLYPSSTSRLREARELEDPALFWVEISDAVPGICWSHFPSLWVTAPSARITKGTIVAFTFHIFLVPICQWDSQVLVQSGNKLLEIKAWCTSSTKAHFCKGIKYLFLSWNCTDWSVWSAVSFFSQ